MSETSNNLSIRRQFIEVPLPWSCGRLYNLWWHLQGLILSPFYLLLSRFAGGPGLAFHLRCMALGARLFLSGRASLEACYNYLFFPMDSTRYIEFHEVWKSLKGFSFSRYLDVSSPRLMPLFLLKANPEATGTLLNPDNSDLQETERLAEALNVRSRCQFFNNTLQDANVSSASFDLISCISVLEHIPEDKNALQIIWSLLRPGGKLILTLPTMAQPLEQYISKNPYGVLSPADDGYTFWQRYYDRERLESIIYDVTGLPKRIVLYGEKKRGLFFRNATMKRLLGGSLYPFWREPYMMATEYQAFHSPDKLPGEGVVMLEFIKPGTQKTGF
jgi:SAM-dependent methyltransferase